MHVFVCMFCKYLRTYRDRNPPPPSSRISKRPLLCWCIPCDDISINSPLPTAVGRKLLLPELVTLPERLAFPPAPTTTPPLLPLSCGYEINCCCWCENDFVVDVDVDVDADAAADAAAAGVIGINAPAVLPLPTVTGDGMGRGAVARRLVSGVCAILV